MDAVYPCILGEINRLHYLDLLMEKWKDASTILRLEKQLHRLSIEQMVDRITNHFDSYYESGEDYEETVMSIGYALKSNGLRFFFKNRWKCFDEHSNHDADMYLQACTVVILASVHDILIEEVPFEWYIHDPSDED